jgi:hypothetical protein
LVPLVPVHISCAPTPFYLNSKREKDQKSEAEQKDQGLMYRKRREKEEGRERVRA